MSIQRPTPSVADRRSAARRQPAVGTVCHLDPGPHVGLVWNISPGGVSMLLNDRLDPGATVRGLLSTGDSAHAVSVTLRVTHVARLKTGDYMIGGPFHRPLTAEELRWFVGGSGRPGRPPAEG